MEHRPDLGELPDNELDPAQDQTVIPLQFKRKIDGFEYRIAKRDGMVAFLEKTSQHGTTTFEVCVLQIAPAGELMGKFYPAHEKLPSSEQWGTYAWSYSHNDREGAERRYARLVAAAGAPPVQQ